MTAEVGVGRMDRGGRGMCSSPYAPSMSKDR